MEEHEGPTLVVRRGALLCYRIFDVADEIRLDLAAQLTASSRPGIAKLQDASSSLAFKVPPVEIEAGRIALHLPHTRATFAAHLTVRLFDFGAASVLFEVALVPGTSLESLLPVCDELYDAAVLEAMGRETLDRLLGPLGAALEGQHRWSGSESYTIVLVEELEGGQNARQVLASPVMAKLLVGEAQPKRLGAEQQHDVLKHAHSYFEDDLTVIDWNSAFILEPSGSRGVADILEFATSQLLIFRYYDNLLDAELGRIYGDFAQAHRAPLRTLRSPYGRLARGVLRRWVELTEFTERVDNSLKLVGDFYLARVYQSAVARFRIDTWRRSVDSKQALLAQAYTFLKGEVDIRRSTMLEVVVVLLILFEVVAALVRK